MDKFNHKMAVNKHQLLIFMIYFCLLLGPHNISRQNHNGKTAVILNPVLCAGFYGKERFTSQSLTKHLRGVFLHASFIPFRIKKVTPVSAHYPIRKYILVTKNNICRFHLLFSSS